MDMSGPMIVRINDHPEAVEPKDRRHYSIIPEFPSAWVPRHAADAIALSQAINACFGLLSNRCRDCM